MVMYSCSIIKGRASLVIGKQKQRERQRREWAEEAAGAEVAETGA